MKGIIEMDYSQKLSLSFYKTIATLNQAHNIFLVQHQDTNKIYVKKILSIYNLGIYKKLSEHPICGIPKIIDYYENEDELIVIEDYISGCSLEELIHTQTLELTDILHYCIELCTILHQLHTMHPPIIHRDIKPSNIIITEYGHVVLLDFNAAKFFSTDASSDTILLGTKGYAAPEQYGFGASSPKTDIYALGILLKELGSSLPIIPSYLTRIINKCTELNPSDRYDTIKELSDELSLFLMPQPPRPKTHSCHRFLPPGFRTHTFWKMLLATLHYVFFFWLSLSLEVENTYGTALWIERIFVFIMFLSVVLISCNYLDIQKLFPLCNSRHRTLRSLGIFLFDAIVVIIQMFLMIILESLISS